jgi:SPP1 gp7 family putative phage head morphogenesis protein
MTTVQQGLDAGDTTVELADRVKGKFDDMTTARAKTIATTETGAAYGVARHDGMTRAGIQKKKWLTAEDDRVRAAHEDADGQVRDIDEPFDVGGEQLQYPCDEDGSPENVINCRCVSIAAIPGDDDDQAEPGPGEDEGDDDGD